MFHVGKLVSLEAQNPEVFLFVSYVQREMFTSSVYRRFVALSPVSEYRGPHLFPKVESFSAVLALSGVETRTRLHLLYQSNWIEN